MKNRRTLALCAALLLLAACGFTPIHGMQANQADTQSKLAQIEIGIIPDQEGQYLRNALIDRFYKNGRPHHPDYALSIKPISESLVDLDITKTADTTRGQMILSTSMLLSHQRTKKTLLKRDLRAIISYNKLGSEFTNIVSENNARENALNELARQIELQLNLYFKR